MGVLSCGFPERLEEARRRRASTQGASLPAPSQGSAAAVAQSAGGTSCLNCSNPKAEPSAGGAPARRLKAAATGVGGVGRGSAARPPLPSLFPLGQRTHPV